MDLGDGEEVGDGLEGMVEVGESVDDRNRRVLGEICDVGVGAYAGDDGGGHAREDDGGVVERFVDLEERVSEGEGGSQSEGCITPSCMSSLPRNMGEPPMAAMAPSVDTLVRVLRLLKVMATVLPARAARRAWGTSPVDLTAALWCAALRTSVVSSAGETSAMERRWRGAKGDVGARVGGVVEVE